MSTSRPASAAAIVIVLPPLAAYLGGYLWLGDRQVTYVKQVNGLPEYYAEPETGSRVFLVQIGYERRWQETVFEPGTRLESWLTQTDVRIDWGYRVSK